MFTIVHRQQREREELTSPNFVTTLSASASSSLLEGAEIMLAKIVLNISVIP